jgi:hypothetical protein
MHIIASNIDRVFIDNDKQSAYYLIFIDRFLVTAEARLKPF